MSRIAFAALLAVIALPARPAQSPPSFEVASIHRSTTDSEDGYWSLPNTGSFSAHNLTLVRLMVLAYGVDPDQIDNKPSWMESDHFDISAKPAGNIALSREELKPLLRSLLQERFHLVTHTETRSMPGYALTVAKGGPRLQPTKGARFPGYRIAVTDRQLNGLDCSMPYLATMLQHPAGRPVVDKTGLSGGYDIKLDFSPDSATDDSLPSIFTALQDTLGLKLESQKVPVEVVVIDKVDRTPTEN